MDLEDAVKVLWKAGIYAESGMGCTGPLVMMSEANHAKALELLKGCGLRGLKARCADESHRRY